MPNHQPPAAPSAWIEQHAHHVPAGGHVLDLACGGGRHARLFLRLGHPVTAVDRNIDRVTDLSTQAAVTLLEADLENKPWPLPGQRFDAVIVRNYLYRPLLPHIVAAVAPGGLLLYDTYAVGNEHLGRPRNPDFLLRPNELLHWVCADFTVCAYRHGRVDTPRPAMRQSLCAIRRSAAPSVHD